ncbi:methyltransferase domain-containing protein [Actinopolymorpha sp. B17G11]|uniref:class I SAM-dependent methyltransferase n=1 Tax=unclassified Actinopolymorpha TaxID=2627063 RepID=UPI0032D9A1F6
MSGLMASPDALPLTGERTMPGIWHENYWFRRHEVVYHWVAEQFLAAGAGPSWRVLDAGVGEGYGADLLRRTTGARVAALDYDADVTAHVRRTYPDVPVLRGNLVALPYASHVFDAVVSLQTIEHLWDQPAFLAECVRVTRPGGRIVLSTPNRLTFPPGNICHAHELVGSELRALLERAGLESTTVAGLHHGERILAWEHRHGDLVKAQLADPPEDWSPELAAFVTSLVDEDFHLRAGIGEGADLDAALDLLSVANVSS